MPRVITLSAAESEVLSDLSSIEPTTGVANISVYAKQADGTPFANMLVSGNIVVASTGTGNTITAVDTRTDQQGRARFTFASTVSEAKTISATVLGRAVTQTAAVTVTGASGVAALFSSAWTTGTGLSEAALRDTSAAVPWTSYDNDGLTEIIAATGLDFPTTNVLEVTTSWNGSGSSGSIVRLASTIAVPGVGDSLYYRWYWRAAVPSAVSTWGTPHPIQDGFSAATANWEFGVRRTGSGLYKPRFNLTANAWPNDSWISDTDLSTDATYRFEMRLHRTGTTTCTIEARVYNAAGTLILDNGDFFNSNTTANLSSAPTLSLRDAAELAGLNAGSNGAFQGTTSGDHPFVYCYQGGFRVSEVGWCGPFESGETVP
jgi:hypothetical protein